jgi:hypothetical protein
MGDGRDPPHRGSRPSLRSKSGRELTGARNDPGFSLSLHAMTGASMRQAVRVLESNWPEAGYMAEVPGRPGRYVRAPSIPELRSQLRAAVTDGDGSSFAAPSRGSSLGSSETALFVML